MNTRRHWIAAAVASPAAALTEALWAQAKPPVVIGWLIPTTRGEGLVVRAFHDSMAALGWKAGTQYVLEERYAQGRAERLPELAQKIVATKPAVIVVITSAAARAATAAAPATPIVVAIGDPVSTGLVTNLARPGGMITGLSNVSADLNLKCIELLAQSVPKFKRVGLLADSTLVNRAAIVDGARRAAEQLRLEAVVAEVARPEDIEAAVARLAKDKVQGLVLLASVWVGQFQPEIIGQAMARGFPVMGTASSIPRQGGLFCYGPNSLALIQRSASYVDRILKGAKPGELPIELPTTFELILNMKTARQLGLAIPQAVMARATEVIE